MRQLLNLGAVALLVTAVPVKVHANGAALAGGETVVITLQQLSIGRITSTTAAAQLGGIPVSRIGFPTDPASGNTVWAAINAWKAQRGGVITAQHWTALQTLAREQSLTLDILLSRRGPNGPFELVLAGDAAVGRRTYVRAVFGQNQAGTERTYNAGAIDDQAAIAKLNGHVTSRASVREAQSELIAEQMTVEGQGMAKLVGRLMIEGEQLAASMCSAGKVAQCIQDNADGAILAGKKGPLKNPGGVRFFRKKTRAFTDEAQNYRGRREVLDAGYFLSLDTNATEESRELHNCIYFDQAA